LSKRKLAKDYLERSKVRLKMLEFLKNEGAYADVVREAQEVVELMLKGLILYYGLDVPKVHDVSRFIEENINVFPEKIKENLPKIKQISRSLRKERELSFYGLSDWIPSEEYTLEDAERAITWAKEMFDLVSLSLQF
jgi:HEPN domain-containing protein